MKNNSKASQREATRAALNFCETFPDMDEVKIPDMDEIGWGSKPVGF